VKHFAVYAVLAMAAGNLATEGCNSSRNTGVSRDGGGAGTGGVASGGTPFAPDALPMANGGASLGVSISSACFARAASARSLTECSTNPDSDP
jgi:hypothetical protein